MRITVIGAGSWGTTISSVIADGSEIRLWARKSADAEQLRTGGEYRYLPGFELPPLDATADLADALAGADAVLVAVPSHGFRAVMVDAADFIPPTTPVVSLTKGLEEGSNLRMTQVLGEVLGHHDRRHLGVLSGPNLAREIAAGEPAATVVAVRDAATATTIQNALMRPRFRVYTNPDVVGSEIAGTAKNVMAIAAGMVNGLGFGLNTMATMVTRSLAEVARLGIALGGNPLTFGGLSGIGDLMATCLSTLSRNHQVGLELAKRRPIDEIVAEMRMVAEGVKSTEPLLALAAHHGVEMPIAEEVAAVLTGGDPRDSLARLMERAARPEGHGIV